MSGSIAEKKWPRFEPEIAPFFEAATENRLLLKRCGDCAQPHYYPRAHCPHCFSLNTEWFESTGNGTIYTFTVLRGRTSTKVIAYVELAEGPRMLTNIVDCDPANLAIGKKVTVTFREQPDGSSMPFFILAED